MSFFWKSSQSVGAPSCIHIAFEYIFNREFNFFPKSIATDIEQQQNKSENATGLLITRCLPIEKSLCTPGWLGWSRVCHQSQGWSDNESRQRVSAWTALPLDTWLIADYNGLLSNICIFTHLEISRLHCGCTLYNHTLLEHFWPRDYSRLGL